MHEAVATCTTEAKWKLKSILKVQRYHTVPGLINLYKSQLLSYVEYRTPAVYHAAPSVLAPLDSVQGRLLRELSMSDEDALMHFNLAPLVVRRDIAMLGVIHRAVPGLGPRPVDTFLLEWSPDTSGRAWPSTHTTNS